MYKLCAECSLRNKYTCIDTRRTKTKKCFKKFKNRKRRDNFKYYIMHSTDRHFYKSGKKMYNGCI